MNDESMRKLIYMILSAAVLMTAASCQEKWTSDNELGVNDTRLNIRTTDEGTFTFSVYSGTDWTLTVTQGEDWLIPRTGSGNGIGYVEFAYTYNPGTSARVAKFTLKASTGKEIEVCVVQSGMTQDASSLTDFDLL